MNFKKISLLIFIVCCYQNVIVSMDTIKTIKIVRDHIIANPEDKLSAWLYNLVNDALYDTTISCQEQVTIVGLLKEKEYVSPSVFTILQEVRKAHPKKIDQLENIYLISLKEPVVLFGCS